MSLIHCVQVARSVFSGCLNSTIQFPLCVSHLKLHYIYIYIYECVCVCVFLFVFVCVCVFVCLCLCV
jgi:hypothetical protein